MEEAPPLKDISKQQLSEEIEKQTQEFLRRGGVVQVCAIREVRHIKVDFVKRSENYKDNFNDGI